ncbi:hypothetical protein CJI97_003483 [Candidozyma auris]|uniref:Alcohol acetyltransferase n=2 Tax=Candidozyma auris TaxID=498019 RepID=A0A8F3AG40_CANAR|nr:hypothetical protein CJI97_003483 [[Candida] auris]QWW21853.1 hypothetical protein CA7LBN_000599 [[Candida] auris]
MSRPVGPVERYYLCRLTMGYCNNGFSVSARFNKPIDDVLLSNALRMMILKNPVFSLNFFREKDGDRKHNGDNFVVRSVSKIAYDQAVQPLEAASYGPELLEQLDAVELPLNVDRPTWKMFNVKLRNNEPSVLVFVCNHIFFDGNASANVFDELLWCFDEVEKLQPTTVRTQLFNAEADNLAPQPSSEIVAPHLYETPTLYKIKTLLLEIILPHFLVHFFLVLFSKGTPNTYKYPRFNPVPQRKFNVSKHRLLSFTPSETAQLLAKCKMNALTLTPYIGGCAYTAMQEHLVPYANRIQGYKPSQRRSINIPIALCGRRYIPEHAIQSRFGLYMSQTLPFVPPKLSTVKKVGDHLKQQLDKTMASRSAFKFAGMLRYVNVWDWFEEEMGDRNGRGAIEISNIGCKKFSRGGWEVTDMFFTQGVSITHLTLSVVSTPKGGLHICVSCVEDMDHWEEDGKKLMDEFLSSFRATLMS